MITDIRKAIEKIMHGFSISMSIFEENRDSLHVIRRTHIIPSLTLNVDELFESILFFGETINISFQNIEILKLNFETDKEIFRGLIKEYLDEEIRISIRIDKNALLRKILPSFEASMVSLYIDMTKFISMLKVENLEVNIFGNESAQIIILPFWQGRILSNEFLIVIGMDYLSEDIEDLQLNSKEAKKYSHEKIRLLDLYSNVGNMFKNVTPKHLFALTREERDEDKKLSSRLDILVIQLILYFICNKGTSDRFLIRGYKELEIENDDSTIQTVDDDVVEKAYELYNSIYSIQTYDKLLISRNVITIYLNEKNTMFDFVNNIDKIIRAYNSSADNYVKDKIKNFFDKKKELEKYVRDTSESISKQIATISDNMMKSWLALIAAILGGIATYFAKANPWLIALFFLLFFIFTLLLLIYQLKVTKEEKKLNEESFEHFLQNIDVLDDDRKAQIVGTVIDKKNALLDKAIFWFSMSMGISAFIAIVMAVIFSYVGHSNLNIKEEPPKQQIERIFVENES